MKKLALFTLSIVMLVSALGSQVYANELPENFGPNPDTVIDINASTKFKWNGPGESKYPFVQYMVCFEASASSYYCINTGTENYKLMTRTDWDKVDAEMSKIEGDTVKLEWYIQSRFSNGKLDGEELLRSEAWPISYKRKPATNNTQEQPEQASDQIRIIEAQADANSITISVKNENLAAGEMYFAECLNPEQPPQVFEDLRSVSLLQPSNSSTDVAIKLTVGPLDTDIKHKCYAAIKKPTNVFGQYSVINHSETVYVTTKKSGLNNSDYTKFKLPPAGFEDKVVYKIELFDNPFTDTDLDELSGKAAAELYRRAVIGGFPDGEFKGELNVNRAEAAKFLLLAKGLKVEELVNNKRFVDVIDGEWYTKFVMTAAKLGVISGYADGSFRPASEVNTVEFLKMLTLAFDLPTNLEYSYKDVETGAWYSQYAGIAEKYKLFPDRTANLKPEQFLTRTEVAIAIYQYLSNR